MMSLTAWYTKCTLVYTNIVKCMFCYALDFVLTVSPVKATYIDMLNVTVIFRMYPFRASLFFVKHQHISDIKEEIIAS